MAGDAVREWLDDPAVPSKVDPNIGFGAYTDVLADDVAAVDGAPEATTDVHPRCAGAAAAAAAAADPCVVVVVFDGLPVGVLVVAVFERQDGGDGVPLIALKSASLPRPWPWAGAMKVDKRGFGIRVSMRRMTCTLSNIE